MIPLTLHPSCRAGSISEVFAAIAPTASGCRASFKLVGDIGAIRIPEHGPAQRQDNLWQTTCCEIFWQAEGGTEYSEFNLSPSRRWACYHFDDIRLNRRDGPVEGIAITCSHDDRTLALGAEIAAELSLPAKVALTAVVEDKQGNIQFWALDFPPGKPEFHGEIGRTLRLEPEA